MKQNANAKKTYDNGTDSLDGEGNARGQLRVLTHLEITNDTTRLHEGVVAVQGEVHVGLGTAGDDSGAEHLDQVLDIGRETLKRTCKHARYHGNVRKTHR